MKYKVIFAFGYDYDIISISKGNKKADVLILDEHGDYYCPQFITAERLYNNPFPTCLVFKRKSGHRTRNHQEFDIGVRQRTAPSAIQLRWLPIKKEESGKLYIIEMDL